VAAREAEAGFFDVGGVAPAEGSPGPDGLVEVAGQGCLVAVDLRKVWVADSQEVRPKSTY